MLPISVLDRNNHLERAKRANRVLIAEGNLLFRRGLRALLSAESDMQVVEEASDATEAFLKVHNCQPDVLLMDLGLLQGTGVQAAISLRQALPSVAILFLTQEDGPEQFELAMAAGARGYMLKNSAPPQIVAGVRQVILHDEQNPQGLSRIMPDLQALAASNLGYPRPALLTARELEVMRLLAEGRTVREVAAELSLSVKTIEAHKLNLMRKLDIHDRASLVEYALQKGIAAPVAQREPVPVVPQ
jgi:two-component system response regulator NreC